MLTLLSRRPHIGSGFEVSKEKMPPDLVGRSSTWVTNTLALEPYSTSQSPLPSISTYLSTPPISLSGSSYASSITSSPGYPQGPWSSAYPEIMTATRNAGDPTHHPAYEPLLTFLSGLFPYQTTPALSLSHYLEIVIPNYPAITGCVLDLPYTTIRTRSGRTRKEGGRTVYLHLPPFHSPVSQALPNTQSPIQTPDRHAQAHMNIDIRDHLTSLLDLVSESLNASELVLVLKREEREDDELRELLHALAYVGGGVLSRVKGGWEFNQTHWVLVGIEV